MLFHPYFQTDSYYRQKILFLLAQLGFKENQFLRQGMAKLMKRVLNEQFHEFNLKGFYDVSNTSNFNFSINKSPQFQKFLDQILKIKH